MMDSLQDLIKRLQEWVKVPANLGLAMVALFFLSIIFSAVKLATLKHNLIYYGGMTSSGSENWVLSGVILSVSISFLLGLAAIYVNQKVKKEIIVYVEKKEEQHQGDEIKTTDEAYFDFKAFQDGLAKTSPSEEKLKYGFYQLCKFLEAGQGALYQCEGDEARFSLGFAFSPELEISPYKLGEGLVGQAASGKSIYLDELPEDYLNTIESGLGSARPRSLFLLPLTKGGKVTGVIEVAAFKLLSPTVRTQAQEAAKMLAENC